ncbi:MAG: hydrogenase 4 subunit B [Chloroflexales bacterium]|nr:hydrogenase 4 subunit B [Chloroflexales bacterium]
MESMTILVAVMIGGYAVGALAALLGGTTAYGRWLAALGAMSGAGAGAALGLVALLAGQPWSATLRAVLPLTGLALRLDGLSGFFLLVVGMVGIPAALYGASYSAHYAGRYSLRRLGALLNLLLFALSLQLLADNALTFLLSWELMSLGAYLLVLTEHDQPETARAALWYIVMTHAGFAALVAMFLLLAGGDLSASFSAMRAAAPALDPALRTGIFALALFGFGSKAGIVPLHVWLPLAHPVAPSHVSALMSGVVIKMGIYGLVRVLLDLLGEGPAWWGATVLALGAVSALLGVLYALMEHDLKRLLAYHSVENIGIILIGVGAGLFFRSFGRMDLAILGIIAGLYHTINHAAFKGLLFLGAGAVLQATHTRNMEELGGLIKPMPWTAGSFLIGSAAISALPPLNGFASEWLVFQTLLGGFSVPALSVTLGMPIAVAMLALTSGLAAACFVKAFGITFLALPRSEEAAQAREAPWPMLLGMGLLALACIGLGLAPFLVVPLLGAALAGMGGLPAVAPPLTNGLAVQTPGLVGQVAAPLVALALALMLGLTLLGLRVAGVNRRLRRNDAWGCGRIGHTARMEYTATSFAEPLRRIFAELYRPREDVTVDSHPESRYFIQAMSYESAVTQLIERRIYAPLLRLIEGGSRQIRRLQSGSLHAYLLYITLALAVLVLAAQWP